jgi:DNA polymerase V
MIDAGIHPSDILIVDKSLDPLPNNVVVAVIDGKFLVKRIIKENGIFFLVPDNPTFQRIELKDDMHAGIWGVVTYSISKAK